MMPAVNPGPAWKQLEKWIINVTGVNTTHVDHKKQQQSSGENEVEELVKSIHYIFSSTDCGTLSMVTT